MKLNKKIIVAIIGLAGVLLALVGVFCPWVSVNNEMVGGGATGAEVSGWEMTGATVGTQMGPFGGPYFWTNTVDGLLILTTKQSAYFTPNILLFGCFFTLVLGVPMAFAGRFRAACILLFIGAFFVLVGAVAGLGDYGMGRGTFLTPISGVTAVEQAHMYGIYICLVGSILCLASAFGETVIWMMKGGKWKKI